MYINESGSVANVAHYIGISDTQGWDDEKQCTQWGGSNMDLFQAANVFHLAAFVIPHNFKASALLMRLTLLVGQILFVIWAAFDICAPEILAWNLALILVNVSHAIYLGVKVWPPLIPDHLKDLYVKLFQPLKVNRRSFRTLVRDAEVKWLEPGQYYAEEESTPADQRLSILLQGKVKVTCDAAHLHYVFPNQFMDSPEWEAAENSNPDKFYQVSLMAEERSRYITWSKPKLKQLLESKPFLKAIIRCLIGKDITMKLYSLNEYQNTKGSGKTDASAKGGSGDSVMLRSRSADTVHMGSTGFIRSDVWLSHKDPEKEWVGGGTPGPKRAKNL